MAYQPVHNVARRNSGKRVERRLISKISQSLTTNILGMYNLLHGAQKEIFKVI